MEIGILTIVITVVVVWYFGSSINSIVKGSGEMASDEFTVFKRDQKIRHHKTRISQTEQLDKIKDANVYSDSDFADIFNVISKDETK